MAQVVESPCACLRNDFCFLHQNHFSWTLHIWEKENVGVGKCIGWPFNELDPRSHLWYCLTKICLSARLSENHSSNHYKAYVPLVLRITWFDVHGWPSTQPGTCTQPCSIVHTAVHPLFTQPCPARTMGTAVCIYVAGLCASCPAV